MSSLSNQHRELSPNSSFDRKKKWSIISNKKVKRIKPQLLTVRVKPACSTGYSWNPHHRKGESSPTTQKRKSLPCLSVWSSVMLEQWGLDLILKTPHALLQKRTKSTETLEGWEDSGERILWPLYTLFSFLSFFCNAISVSWYSNPFTFSSLFFTV